MSQTRNTSAFRIPEAPATYDVSYMNQLVGTLRTYFVKNDANTANLNLASASYQALQWLNTGGGGSSYSSGSYASNLSGGNTGYVPYQSAPNTTTFLAPTVNGYVMTLSGGVPVWAAPSGSTGPTGPQGPATFLEAEYQEADMFLVPGGVGPQGIQGNPGTTGANGPATYLEADYQEADMFLVPGPAGATGANGSTGAQGPQGPATYLEADVIEPDFFAIPGATGPQGNPGATGAQGAAAMPIGLDGADGDDGMAIPGPVGPQGVQGIQGVPGATGPAAYLEADYQEADMFVVQGNQGIQGVQGNTGAQGPIGPATHMLIDDSYDDPANYVTPPPGPSSGTAGVTQIVAGTNISISPVGGTGVVTINSSGGGASSPGGAFMPMLDDPVVDVLSEQVYNNNFGTNAFYNTVTATANISNSANTGAHNYGTLSYSDTNTFAAFTTSVNSYAQEILQNTNAGNTASADYIVSNNLGTANTYYGDFGINSSTFAGTGSFSLPNATYMYSQNGDLVLGTYSANTTHFVTNNGNDVMYMPPTGGLVMTQPVSGTTITNVPIPDLGFDSVVDVMSEQMFAAGIAGPSNYNPAAVAITGGTINGTTIGATTASTGKFTTIGATGLITPSTTVGIKGTAAADSAQAGSIGEVITATGTAVSLTSATSANCTSISLTAGDWDVYGSLDFAPAVGTTVTVVQGGISATTASLPAAPNLFINNVSYSGINQQGGAVPTQRINISATATYYLVAAATFTTSTLTVTGTIWARRAR